MSAEQVLITGASGFLGRHAADAVAAEGASPTTLDRDEVDLTDGGAVAAKLAEIAPGAVIHLAGVAQRGLDPDAAARAEQAMGTALISAAATLADPPRVVIPGSAAEYGDLGPDLISEAAEAQPISDYGKWRLELGELLRSAARVKGVPFTWGRTFNLFGPGQGPQAPISNWARQLVSGAREIEVGALDVKRDFLDVRDAGACLAKLALAPDAPALVNVCSGQARLLQHLLGSLIQIAGAGRVEIKPDHELVAMRGPEVVVGDPTLLRETIGEIPKRRATDSLRDLVTEAGDSASAAGAPG